MVTAILIAVVVFFGCGTAYEAYQDRGWPSAMGPKFLIVSLFLVAWLIV